MILAGYYHLIEKSDDSNDICPENPDFGLDPAEAVQCTPSPTTDSPLSRSVAFYLITEGKESINVVLFLIKLDILNFFFDSDFADLPNSCYYTTQVALESQIEKAIKLVKDEFGIIIEADYLNDGCSSSESLNTAIQRYFFCLIIQILRDH